VRAPIVSVVSVELDVLREPSRDEESASPRRMLFDVPAVDVPWDWGDLGYVEQGSLATVS